MMKRQIWSTQTALTQVKDHCPGTIALTPLAPAPTCDHPAGFCAYMASNPANLGLIITMTCLSDCQAGNH
ncbi:unnamed protein product [Tetraodon nigroviridis]|uniref:(spotted green pufferfish) hypothetical protein n=1 Tax=Tetraodon nigroviridis TaxID=99883 RepID=Q4REU1_TETNG|nr:unnamed protein product [Tetraodon nigroviridis]